jgi:hypothetical protein
VCAYPCDLTAKREKMEREGKKGELNDRDYFWLSVIVLIATTLKDA